MPPSTTPASTMIVSWSAKSDVTSGFWTVSITATTAASAPERSTATPITRLARTPSRRAVSKSIDAARMCRPIVVRSSSAVSATRQTTATTIATIEIFRTSTPAMSTGRLRKVSDVAILPKVPNFSWAMLCSRNATANVATSITAGDWRAERAEHEPVEQRRERQHDREAEDDPGPDAASSTPTPSRARTRPP